MAWIALTLWPIVGIVLFRKLSLPTALCITIIAGYLLLPERVGLDLPVLPELNKFSIPSLVALIMTALALRRGRHNADVLRGWLPRNPVVLGLMGLLVIGAFGTALTNRDPLIYGSLVLSGTRLYDGFSSSLAIGIALIPMLLARRLLATPEAHRILLLVLVVSALIYTIPTLWEVRMSPQLHRQVYGFFQHSFFQQMRGGGFRAMVFLGHGLTLAIFLSLAVLAAVALMRLSDKYSRIKWGLAAAWLFLVLVLSKSLGPFLITVCLLPVVLFLQPRMQLLVAACIAVVVVTYPLLRASNLIPVDRIASFAERIDPVRANSLNVRLTNEEILLEKASQRPIFGWGGWRRNRVFSEKGDDISITDGEWIINLGIGGWVRYIGLFGLLCWPILGLFISKRERIDPVCAVLALALCAKLVDLIPNSGVHPYIWLISGSLLGRLELRLIDFQKGSLSVRSEVSRPPPSYTRDFGRPSTDYEGDTQPSVQTSVGYVRTNSRVPLFRK